MGRGLAKEAKERFPELPVWAAQEIMRECGTEHWNQPQKLRYGLLVGPNKLLGLFQVKYHFWEAASTELIRWSCLHLLGWCENNPNIPVNLNYPGIGNGHLKESDVYPYIKELPDRVTVWKR